MKISQVLLISCFVASICLGAMGQSITGTLTLGQVLNAPYTMRANVFLEQDGLLLDQSAVSGEDGVFLIDDITSGTYSVLIIGEGMGRVLIPDVVVSSGSVTDLGTIPLSFECKVIGTVTEPDGITPLADVSVILESDSPFDILDLSEPTDDTGSYSFDKLSVGNYVLRFYYEGQYFGEQSIGFTQPSQTRLVTSESPPPIGSIVGKVTKSDGVTGIQGAIVSVYDGNTLIKSSITDVAGIYIMHSVPEGVYTVLALIDNYIFPESQENIAVFHNQVTADVNFTAAPVGAIAGIVYGGETELADVFVYLKERPGINTRTNENGEYILEFIAPGTHIVSARHSDYSFDDRTGVVVNADEITSNIDFISEALGGITGQIMETDMLTPIFGVEVRAVGTGKSGITDQNGIYIIGGLVAGSYNVSINLPTDSFVSRLGVIENVVVVSGETTEEINFIAPGGSISGWVGDVAQVPIVGAEVKASMGSRIAVFGITDGYGNYYIPYLQEGNYTLEVSPNQNGVESIGINDVSVLMNQNTGEQNFVLSSGGSITGRIIDDTGLPVSDAEIMAENSTTHIFHPGVTTSDENGFYLLKDVSEGMYIVAVFAEGYPSTGQENVSVLAGQETSNIDFILNTEGGAVRGFVYDASTQEPLSDVYVYFENSFFNSLKVRTMSDGSYSASPLPPGNYQAIASSKGYEASQVENVLVVTGQVSDDINFFLNSN